jgi:pimeloyl-ACP methyl ester carboxylesterase
MTLHQTLRVDDLSVFYREAGDPGNPKLVLLGGFPASSHQFRHLMPALADRFHLIAPDYPGFGNTEMPDPATFSYTFDRLAHVVEGLLAKTGFTRCGVFMQDYGGPIGFRIASRHPDRVTALISQNANAYVEGFTPFWDGLFAYAEDGVTNEQAVRESLEPAGTQWVYTHGVPADRRERLSPDTWTLDQLALDRPGNREVQLALFRDYRFNVDEYPTFHGYFRAHRPPTLVVWGEHDEIFGPDGATAFRRDLPDAEIHLLDAGHYALETSGEEIAELVRAFLGRVL